MARAPAAAAPCAPTSRRHRHAFTVIELLTVIGILVVLFALLMPSLIGARRAAQTVQCASNMRQLTAALINYSVEFRGAFPPNSAEIEQYWFSEPILGRYLKSPVPMPDGTIAGGVMVCPGDLDQTLRSYSMNVFASGYVSSTVSAALAGSGAPGKLFKAGARESSKLILTIESFSSWAAPGHEPTNVLSATTVGYTCNAIIGFWGDRPGMRFGAGSGVPFPGGDRFADLQCQVCYFRHRNSSRSAHAPTDAFGRTNIGFLDGHVQLFAHDELANFATGRSTYEAMWSTIDRDID